MSKAVFLGPLNWQVIWARMLSLKELTVCWLLEIYILYKQTIYSRYQKHLKEITACMIKLSTRIEPNWRDFQRSMLHETLIRNIPANLESKIRSLILQKKKSSGHWNTLRIRIHRADAWKLYPDDSPSVDIPLRSSYESEKQLSHEVTHTIKPLIYYWILDTYA